MKLKVFNAATSSLGNKDGKAYVNINCKSGALCFNLTASAILGFKEGDRVSLHQDEESPDDWYACKDNENETEGFKIRIKDSGSCIIQSSKLARAIRESIKKLKQAHTFRIPIAPEHTDFEGKKLYALLTVGLTVLKTED